ncbi:MAG: hypothetical protein J6Y44_02165, partial [Clostridia bacterium]|nr:hypothetical protein [Clostridia bacterium]
MKKNIFKTLLCVLLCVSMLGAAIMTSACNPTSVPSGQISSDADPSDRDSGENGSNENVQLVDRSDYTADKAAQIISDSNVTDIIASFKGQKDSPLKDFMIGDFINMIVEEASESLIGGGADDMIGGIDLGESDIDGLIGSIGGLLPFDLPNGTNLSGFA